MAYSRTRARDSDRLKAVEILDAALLDGQLDHTEHAARRAKLESARTLADLDAQFVDLQKPGQSLWQAPDVKTPFKVSHGGKIALIFGVIAVVLTVVVPRVFFDDDPNPSAFGAQSPTPEMSQEPEPIKDPHTPEGYAEFLAAMNAKLGSTEMTRAYLSDDSVTVTVPLSPQKTRRYVTWSWDGEWEEYSTGRYSDHEEIWLLDLAQVDSTKFAAAMERALDAIEDPESLSLSIQSNGESCYTVSADNRFDESYYGRFACDGSVVEAN